MKINNMDFPVYKHCVKLLKFGVSGGSSLVTSVVVLYICTHFFHIWYIFSSILSFIPAFLVSFLLQKYWTFENDSQIVLWIQMVRYFVVILIALLLNTVILFLLVEHAHFHYVVAQTLSGIIIAIYNFLLYRKFVFQN